MAHEGTRFRRQHPAAAALRRAHRIGAVACGVRAYARVSVYRNRCGGTGLDCRVRARPRGARSARRLSPYPPDGSAARQRLVELSTLGWLWRRLGWIRRGSWRRGFWWRRVQRWRRRIRRWRLLGQLVAVDEYPATHASYRYDPLEHAAALSAARA